MSKKSAQRVNRARVPVPLTDIQEEFRAQLKLLKKSCDAYDAGDRDEFRRIATAVRVLVYDHGQSRSVASQLGLKSIPFLAYSRPVDPRNLLSETPLVVIRTGQEDITYLPLLSNSPRKPRSLTFDSWWSEDAFRSSGGVSMARSGFILHTANQAGGAHVDPDMDEGFYKIARANEAGWISNIEGVEKPLLDLEKAYVRHIGFEVFEVLEPEWKRICGNRFCECGSGIKYRYCHGKES